MSEANAGQPKPKRSRKRRWIIGGIVAVLLAAVLVWWFRPLDPIKPKIGKETTYLTEPVREDGTIDYLAALNNRLSEGVTPENNAFVDIARVMRRDAWQSQAHRRFVFDRLGVDPPAEDAPRLMDFDAFMKKYGVDFAAKDTPSKQAFLEKLRAAIDAQDGLSPKALDAWLADHTPTSNKPATRPSGGGRGTGGIMGRTQPQDDQPSLPEGPWRAADRPLVFAWLKRNEPMLVRITEAANKPEFYAPYWASEGPEVVSSLMPWLGSMGQAGETFAARARLFIAQGDLTSAWRDVMTIQRLGGSMPEDGALIAHLVGVSLRGMGHTVVQKIASSPDMTRKLTQQIQQDLSELSAPPPSADAFDYTQRLMALDATVYLWRSAQRGKVRSEELLNTKQLPRNPDIFNPNPTLRKLNDLYDDLAKMGRKDSFPKYKKAMGRRKQKMDQASTQVDDIWWLKRVGIFLAPPSTRREFVSKQVGDQLMSIFMPAASAAYRAEWKTKAQRDLAQVAIALAGYRAEHGAYPEQLSALSPDWLNNVPDDLFIEKPLHYNRRGADEAILYSVGPDQKDDGGEEPDDLRVHLKPMQPATVRERFFRQRP
jgi:hypothetical protein